MEKKTTTIICCICFALGGFAIAATKHADLYNKTAVAATPQPVVFQYPKDLLLGHTNNVGLTTVHDTIRDTVPLEICCVGSTRTVYKTKIKWKERKDIVPDTICRQAKIDVDTIRISKPTIVIPETVSDSVSL